MAGFFIEQCHFLKSGFRERNYLTKPKMYSKLISCKIDRLNYTLQERNYHFKKPYRYE